MVLFILLCSRRAYSTLNKWSAICPIPENMVIFPNLDSYFSQIYIANKSVFVGQYKVCSLNFFEVIHQK